MKKADWEKHFAPSRLNKVRVLKGEWTFAKWRRWGRACLAEGITMAKTMVSCGAQTGRDSSRSEVGAQLTEVLSARPGGGIWFQGNSEEQGF